MPVWYGCAAAIKITPIRTGPDPEDVKYVHEIKLWPKSPALDSLSRNLGLFEEHNKQKKMSLMMILNEIDHGGLPPLSGL